MADELAQTERLAAEMADVVMSAAAGRTNVLALPELRAVHASLARRAAKLRRSDRASFGR